MYVALLLSLVATLLFGIAAIVFSIKEERLRKRLTNSPQAGVQNKIKDDFLHMMIHELRAPLTAIKGAAELMISSSEKLKDEEKNRLLHLIESQSKSLLEQVSALLDIAKIESQQFSVQKAPLDINKVITETVSVFVPEAETKHITIKNEVQVGLPVVVADQLRITQVLNNLLSNSIKFTPENGTITLKAWHDTTPPQRISVSVTDTGVGIPLEKQQNLFHKFYQVGNGNIPQQLGSGLGLYITKHIVEAHGGTIELTSTEGKGTTITFTLPL